MGNNWLSLSYSWEFSAKLRVKTATKIGNSWEIVICFISVLGNHWGLFPRGGKSLESLEGS